MTATAGATTATGLSRIGQISVTAKDIDRAISFYRDRLGIPFLFQAGTIGIFQCGDVRLFMSIPEPEFAHPSSVLYFAVSDIAAMHRTLAARGVEFRDEPHIVHRADSYDLWMAFFRDTEGNTLAIMEERKP